MITTKPYSHFSKIYSHLMDSVDYSYWANYIKEIHSTIGDKNDLALEIGAGNCKLSTYLIDEFRQLTLSDISLEMLKLNKSNFNTVCCSMLNLPFKCKFDFIISTFDTVNYINTEEGLIQFFSDCENVLSKNAFLVFDVSLKHNSLKHLRDLNRKGKYKGIEYNQISEFDEKNSLHVNKIEIKLDDKNIYNEVHIQKIYDFYYYFEVLESVGLFVVECFDAFTFNNGSAESKRIQFIVKRKC